MQAAGKLPESLSVYEQALASALGSDYAPLLAEVQLARAQVLDNLGKHDEAAEAASAGMVAAERGRDLRVLAKLRILYASLLGDRKSQTAEGRAEVEGKLSRLIDTIEEMNRRQDDVASISGALERVAVGQETIAELMRAHGDVGIDAESRMRLRSIDVQMLRILEEISAGRQESLAELRKDIDLLVKAFAGPRGMDRAARMAARKES